MELLKPIYRVRLVSDLHSNPAIGGKSLREAARHAETIYGSYWTDVYDNDLNVLGRDEFLRHAQVL